jgi:hypothetical protein
MWERAASDVAIPVREFGEALGQDRERLFRDLSKIRRDLSEIRRAVAIGRETIAETLALMAVADALATPVYYGRPRTIEAATQVRDGSIAFAVGQVKRQVTPDGL